MAHYKDELTVGSSPSILGPNVGPTFGTQPFCTPDDPEPFFFDKVNPDISRPQTSGSSPHQSEDIFSDTKVGLDLPDFAWFVPSLNYLSTDSAPNFQSTNTSPVADNHALPTEQTVPVAIHTNAEEPHSLQPTYMDSSQRLPCLCNPQALNIIAELQHLQKSMSALDAALIGARRGFSIVSSCLSCSTCLATSRSLFYACVLIIQQAFTCYGAVRTQGSKLLSPQMHSTPQRSVVSIGDFEIEDEEGCNSILDAIVRAEMERAKGILGGLEQWVERSTNGSPKSTSLLLRTLKEEIGCF